MRTLEVQYSCNTKINIFVQVIMLIVVITVGLLHFPDCIKPVCVL